MCKCVEIYQLPLCIYIKYMDQDPNEFELSNYKICISG